MSGQYNGLQAKIIEENPHAFYIWCSAHRLNLIVSQAVGSCLNTIHIFGKLEKMFTFISRSKKRAAIFKEKQKMLYPKKQIRSLKRVDTTRWMSHSYALTTVLDTYYAVYLTIEEIQITEGTSDYMLGSECLGLLSYITSYRTDEKFNKIVEAVKVFVEACEIENFTPLENARSRKKKRIPRKADELCQDEIINNRFTDNNLEVLKDLALLSIKRINEIKINIDKIPKDAFKSMCSVYHTFLNLNDIKREYERYIQSDFNLSNKLPDYLHSCLNDTSNNSDYSDDESMSQESNLSKFIKFIVPPLIDSLSILDPKKWPISDNDKVENITFGDDKIRHLCCHIQLNKENDIVWGFQIFKLKGGKECVPEDLQILFKTV
ncbi:hypothetical protein QTP88_005326 [Uroleucon formosanum]